MQRDGKILVGEDFTPFATAATNMNGESKLKQRVQSVSVCRTKSQLMAQRREESLAQLETSYGDL